MVFVLKMVIFYSYVKLPEGIQNDIMIYHDLFIHLPRAKKNSVLWSAHGLSQYRLLLIRFIKTTVPLQKKRLFPINLHFVCALALPSV